MRLPHRRQGPALRAETRIPGADANPYLAFAALIAAGLHGIENELPLPAAFEGNAYESDVERFPHSLREAIAALESGTMARAALGDEVVDHYLNYARTEQQLFDSVVTCYERERMFERGHAGRPATRGCGRSSGSRPTRSRRAGAPGTCPRRCSR